jgi:hypothetical protein
MTRELERNRERLVKKMLGIRSMRRGTLNEQFVERKRDGLPTGEVRGPYYVLSRRHEGKTVSERVSGAELQDVRDDLDRYKEFTRLCEEFAKATESLGEYERDRAASEEAEKKGLKSRRKSRPR